MPFDREAMDETEFERRLLAAARRDPGPSDVAGAWARFAGALAPVVADPALGGVSSATRVGAAPATGARVGLAAAMKWVLVGAVAGSAATAAVFVRPGSGPADVPRERPVAIAKGAAAPPASPAPPTAESTAGRERATTPHGARAKAKPGLLARAESADSDAAAPVAARLSPLAAEVARIDAARTSNAIGDYDGTVQLIERYHRDFPDGALAPDAEVVALEAVAAKRDRAETARRAALFLSRYPDDPHAARVKFLAQDGR